MSDYSELKRLADRVISDRRFCGDENHKALADGVAALIAENERLTAKIEQVRSRSVSLDCSPDGVIPNAMDAWGRAVPQHLPYDFSGNPGASATQYCNGWNDAGGYWKAHCVDIQSERDQLKAENEALRKSVAGKVVCPLELFKDLRDSAADEAAQYRAGGMAEYRPHRMYALDKTVTDCDELIAAMSKGGQS